MRRYEQEAGILLLREMSRIGKDRGKKGGEGGGGGDEQARNKH